MPTIRFRAKVREMRNVDDTLAWRYLDVPAIKRHHCDMAAFRVDARFRHYANSDLFQGMLKRALEAKGIKKTIRLDRIPEGVSVNTAGFLADVTINLEG